MENTISKIAKVKSKKSKAGVFITLPDDIAKQFPLLGAHDDSDPHITVLFIGVVPKKHEDLLAETVKKVAKECEPFVMKLDDKVTYFPPTKHSDGCKIAKMKIISEGLHELHKALKKAITDAGIEIDDHFSSYKPHTTLAYMQPPRKTYDREVPSGSWLAEEIHIWNGDDKKKIRLGNNKKANDMISVRAGVKSDKPAYKEKIKTDKGYVWKYDEKHIEKRWKVKKDKIKKLEKDIRKVREQYKKDLNSDDDRTRAIAAIVGIMDDTAMRIGNEESAKDGTFGASTLKVKHVKNNKGKITFDFPGKGAIEQNVILKNKEVIKTINDLMKGKKANDFIFEVDGKKIWDRAVNRYLDQFGISAKDLRGFHSNRLMKEMLKKKDWKDALKEVSEIVGHEATTLKNQYIDPDIVEKYENKQKKDKKSERIMILKAYDDQIEQSDIGGPELSSTQLEQYMPQNLESGNQPNQPVNIYKNIGNIKSKVVDQKEQIKISPLIATAWNIIAPFMPSTVYLSSGFRSMRDQVNTIINYWNDKWGGYFAKNFPDRGKTVADMHKIINEYDPSIPGTPPGGPTREEATIAFPGKSLHQSGNALDISGVSANDITKIIEWINRHLGAYVSFNVLNEGDHVHVSIKKAIYPGPQNMMSVLREFYYGIKAPEITKTQKHQVYLSKRASGILSMASIKSDLTEKYPNIRDGIESAATKVEPKYLKWFVKEFIKSPNDYNFTKIIDYINEFNNYNSILSNKDLYSYDLQSLVNEISQIKQYKDQALRLADEYFNLLKEKRNLYISTMSRQESRKKAYEEARQWLNNIQPPQLQTLTRQAISSHIRRRELGDTVGKDNKEMARSSSDIIYEDQNYLVVLPGTTQASKYFGSGTQWCTAAEKNNYFTEYSSSGIYLYYIIDKQSQRSDNPLRKIAWVMSKQNEKPEIKDIFNALDNNINRTAVRKYLGKDYSNIINSINMDISNRKDTKFQDILKNISKNQLEYELKALDQRDQVNILKIVIGQSTNTETKDFANKKLYNIAEKWATEDNENFFYQKLQETYPELGKQMAEKWAAEGNSKFFYYKLQKTYPELRRPIAEKWAAEGNSKFFYYKLQKTYPELRRPIAEKWATEGNENFFYQKLQETYPELGKQIAEKWAAEGNWKFFNYELQETYPELGRLIAEKWVKEDDGDFFSYELQETYPELGKQIAEKWAAEGNWKFFNYELQETYPELGRLIAEKWVKEDDGDFFSYELQETYPELGRSLAEKWATEGDRSFFNLGLQEKYPELGRSLAEKWAKEGRGDFSNYGLEEIYPDIKMANQHYQLSKRALNPQDETFVNRLEQKYFGANKPQISTKSKLTQLGIKSNVRLNETILAAWVLLKPYLPQNAVMTSGARTSQDQIRIINNYWTKSKLNEKYPNVTDPYQRSRLLIQNGWVVGPPTSKGKNIHLTGRAFDVSGANLEQIASAARTVSNNPNIPVTFSQVLIEHNNNNVHLGVGQVAQLSEVTNKTASWPTALSKIGAEENMKNQVQSIYEDLMKSNPPKDVADEFVRAFGLEINKNAKVKDDEDGKYEREKSDPKWKQILIDSDRKWTRKEIRDHYIKNADKIMREIKGKPIMIYVNTGKTNQNVLKRKHNEKPIVFNNTNDLKRWADRRLLSIHRVLGPKTTLGFVDLDVHDNFSDSKVKEYARKIAAKIKSKYGSTPIIYDSGGTGYHVEFKVKEMSIDTLRHELRELCEDLNEEFDGFTTGIVKGTGVRTDTTTLKNNGNLRVPWALHEKYGGVKKPIGKTAALSIRQKTAINVEDIGFGVEDEPGDYFEKSRMFLHRQPLEYDKHNAHKLAENDPAKFFYLGLHKSNPSLEAKALENMIKDNPKFYFIFNFDKREEPEFKRLKQKASEELAQQDPRSFFYYNLHHEMPELGRGAILHLIDKDPRSFGQLGLEKDYPDYAESATHAINIYDPTKTEVIDSKASVKLSKRATNEKVDVLYVVHPDAIIEQSTNVDYVNSYLSKVKQAISSHVGPVIVTSLGRKFGSNTEAGDIAKLFMKEISGDSDINVIYETGAERSMLGLKAGEKMLDDLYLNNALGTIKVGGCFTGSWCKMCVDDTIKQLTKQYGPDHVVFDNSITAAAGIVPKGKLFEPSEAPQENKQASVKLSKRDDNVYSFTGITDELLEKIENLPGYKFDGPVGFFGQLFFDKAGVEVQWMFGTYKSTGSLEGCVIEVVIIHTDSDKEHIKDSFSTYEKAYNYLSDTLRDVVSYYQRLEEEKGAEIIPFPKMSSLISKRAEYGPDYGWKKWVQNYSNIPGQKNEKLSSRTLMLKKAFGPTVIAPMRLKKIKDPSELLDKYKKEELSIQHKFDGWKTQAIKDSKGAVKLYTRKGSGFEANVPELVKELEKKLDSGDFVLGELTFEKNGVQSISDVQTIAGSSPEKAQEHLKKTKGHLVFQAYDLLWNNGHDITKESYIERYNKLKKQIGESSIIKVPKNYSWDEFDIAMRNAQKEGSEGVVIKTKDSKYNYGPKGANEKTGDWYKYKIKGKKAQTDEVILNKYEHGKEKLKFPAYQYKDGKLFEVGVLSGLPKDKEKEIKNKIDNGKSVVVEVTYQEIMPSGKFRHMGWGGRERPDKPLKEVKVNK